jgi:hypothetical protein
MDKIGLVFIGCAILFSCSPKQQPNSTMPSQEMDRAISTVEPMPLQETNGVRFINDGAINITNNLNIRDTPSTKGNIVRQSFFGEYFSIYEKRGSGNIENGVMDLWYRVSDGEWINALYLRTFPFYIASDKTFRDNDGREYGFNLNTVVIKIEGYREIIDGKKELKVKIKAHTAFAYEGVFQVTPKGSGDPGYSDQIIELLENYLIDPDQRNIITDTEDGMQRNNYSAVTWRIINSGNYNVKFIDNQFDNLRNYSLELEEIVKKYGTRFNPYDLTDDFTEVEPNVKVFSFHDDTNDVIYEFIYDKRYDLEATTIKIDRLSDIVLNGVNIRSRKEDIILQFGNNFSTEEYSHNGILVEHITYYLGKSDYPPRSDLKSDYPYKVEFILNQGRVQQILYSQITRRK